jgi:hybrid cluster-associated redox disulfide protein
MIQISSKMTIQELLARHPNALTVFIRRRMLCVGCPASAFHAMEDVARIHGITVNTLCTAIREAVETHEKPPADSYT